MKDRLTALKALVISALASHAHASRVWGETSEAYAAMTRGDHRRATGLTDEQIEQMRAMQRNAHDALGKPGFSTEQALDAVKPFAHNNVTLHSVAFVEHPVDPMCCFKK